MVAPWRGFGGRILIPDSGPKRGPHSGTTVSSPILRATFPPRKWDQKAYLMMAVFWGGRSQATFPDLGFITRGFLATTGLPPRAFRRVCMDMKTCQFHRRLVQCGSSKGAVLTGWVQPFNVDKAVIGSKSWQALPSRPPGSCFSPRQCGSRALVAALVAPLWCFPRAVRAAKGAMRSWSTTRLGSLLVHCCSLPAYGWMHHVHTWPGWCTVKNLFAVHTQSLSPGSEQAGRGLCTSQKIMQCWRGPTRQQRGPK